MKIEIDTAALSELDLTVLKALLSGPAPRRPASSVLVLGDPPTTEQSDGADDAPPKPARSTRSRRSATEQDDEAPARATRPRRAKPSPEPEPEDDETDADEDLLDEAPAGPTRGRVKPDYAALREQAREATTALVEQNRQAIAKAALADLGVAKLSSLPDTKLQAYIDAIED